MPGVNIRKITWVMPYCSTNGWRSRMIRSGVPIRKRSTARRSRSAAVAASMNGCFQRPAYSFP